MTPYVLAFPLVYTKDFMLFDNSVNLIFFADVVFCFFSAYYDPDYAIIDSHKVITVNTKLYRLSQIGTYQLGSSLTSLR